MTRRESATRTATATRSASGSIATIGSREPGGQRLSRPTNNRPVVAARPVPKAPAAAPAEPKQRRKTHFQWSTTSAMTTPACTTLPASQAGTPSPTPAEAASSPVKRPVSPAPTITSMGSSGASISSVSSAASDPSLAMRDQVVVAPCALPFEPLPALAGSQPSLDLPPPPPPREVRGHRSHWQVLRDLTAVARGARVSKSPPVSTRLRPSMELPPRAPVASTALLEGACAGGGLRLAPIVLFPPGWSEWQERRRLAMVASQGIMWVLEPIQRRYDEQRERAAVVIQQQLRWRRRHRQARLRRVTFRPRQRRSEMVAAARHIQRHFRHRLMRKRKAGVPARSAAVVGLLADEVANRLETVWAPENGDLAQRHPQPAAVPALRQDAPRAAPRRGGGGPVPSRGGEALPCRMLPSRASSLSGRRLRRRRPPKSWPRLPASQGPCEAPRGAHAAAFDRPDQQGCRQAESYRAACTHRVNAPAQPQAARQPAAR